MRLKAAPATFEVGESVEADEALALTTDAGG